jgi:hypothetical protein
MKKALAMVLLLMVSWALAGTPAQAAESSRPGVTLVKQQTKHKNQKHKQNKKKQKKQRKA